MVDVLKTVVTADELGRLEAPWKGVYEPQGTDGSKFRLRTEAVDGVALGEFEKQQRALDSERSARESLEKAMKGYVGDDGKPLDPAAVKRALAKVSEMSNWKPEDKVREQIEHLKREMGEAHGKELQALREELQAMNSHLDEAVIDAGLQGAIARLGANPKVAKVVREYLRREIDPVTKKAVARVYDDQGNLRYFTPKDGPTRPMTPVEFLEDFAKVPENQIFFPGTGTSGTGGTSPSRAGLLGRVTITRKEASDHGTYVRKAEEAKKLGVPLIQVD